MSLLDSNGVLELAAHAIRPSYPTNDDAIREKTRFSYFILFMCVAAAVQFLVSAGPFKKNEGSISKITMRVKDFDDRSWTQRSNPHSCLKKRNDFLKSSH